MAQEWERYSLTTGKRVRVDRLGRDVQGTAMGIDPDGALWVRDDSGLQERVLAGDVTHLCQ